MVNAGAGEELAGLIKFSPKPRRCGRAGGESDTRGDKNTHPDEGAYRYFFSTSVSFVARPRINSRRILLRSVTRQGGEQQASPTKGLYPTNRRTYNNSPSYFSQLRERERKRKRKKNPSLERHVSTFQREREREKESGGHAKNVAEESSHKSAGEEETIYLDESAEGTKSPLRTVKASWWWWWSHRWRTDSRARDEI